MRSRALIRSRNSSTETVDVITWSTISSVMSPTRAWRQRRCLSPAADHVARRQASAVVLPVLRLVRCRIAFSHGPAADRVGIGARPWQHMDGIHDSGGNLVRVELVCRALAYGAGSDKRGPGELPARVHRTGQQKTRDTSHIGAADIVLHQCQGVLQ